MGLQVIIDGNNLLFAMHAHAPIPNVGRETLVRVVEKWARRRNDEVTIVFDGHRPGGGLAQQLTSSQLDVQFSGNRTADDVIVALIQRTRDPGRIRIVTSDHAIRSEARHRRCGTTAADAFVGELFPAPTSPPRPKPTGEKAKPPASTTERDEWLRLFGFTEDGDTDLPKSDYELFDDEA
jgi:hypothetical protein